MHEKHTTHKIYTTVSITMKIHRSNIPQKITSSVLAYKNTQPLWNPFFTHHSNFPQIHHFIHVLKKYIASIDQQKIHQVHKSCRFPLLTGSHWLNISSFALKILVKNVLNFTAIFRQKSRWKTWNIFVNFLNLVKNFWKSAEKVLKFKKVMKKFQVFHLVFHWKIAVKFKTFFTSIFTEKLEMFNQCKSSESPPWK